MVDKRSGKPIGEASYQPSTRRRGLAIGLLSWFDEYYCNKAATLGWIRPADFLIVRSHEGSSHAPASP